MLFSFLFYISHQHSFACIENRCDRSPDILAVWKPSKKSYHRDLPDEKNGMWESDFNQALAKNWERGGCCKSLSPAVSEQDDIHPIHSISAVFVLSAISPNPLWRE